MARLPRLSIAGQLHHVIQRGHNRQPIFASVADREHMLLLLADHAARFDVAVHAYVLMDNHFHLLTTPGAGDALSKMMQAVGRSYVRYYNDTHQRSGTLWDGRYRSTVVQASRYWLTCMAYIDLNPARAGQVTEARDFAWSSHHHYIGQRVDKLVTPPAGYWNLGNTPFARDAAYARRVQEGVSPQDQLALTQSTLNGWVLGDAEFVASLQNLSNRRLSQGTPGRPRLDKK